MLRKAPNSNEGILTQRGEILSASFSNLTVFLFYTTKNTIRSNRFFLVSLFVYFLLGMIYLGYSITNSILSVKISNFFLISIAFSDVFFKYYMPGVFVEYIYPLLNITLLKKMVSNYVIFNLLFYYHNFAVVFSFFFGVDIKSIFFILSILILNHIFVLVIKLACGCEKNYLMIMFVLLVSILNILCILFIQSLVVVVFCVLITLLVFNQFVNYSFYVK